VNKRLRALTSLFAGLVKVVVFYFLPNHNGLQYGHSRRSEVEYHN
jgi:hypothetical protein